MDMTCAFLSIELTLYPMHRSGLRVITTSSPKHFALLKDRGADVIFDYVSLEALHTHMDFLLTIPFNSSVIQTSANRSVKLQRIAYHSSLILSR